MTRHGTTALSQSQEDYLEAILAVAGGKGCAAVRDIARHQGVSMPSVHGAVLRLARLGLVTHGRYDYVELTAAGQRRASEVSSRHALLKRFLAEVLGIAPSVADRDACAIEHHLSPATVAALTAFLARKGRRRG